MMYKRNSMQKSHTNGQRILQTHLFLLFVTSSQVFREKFFSCGIELETILRPGKAMTLIWEEHVLVLDTLTFHCLHDLLRFALLHPWIISSLRNQDRNLYLFHLEQRRTRFQKLLFCIRITNTVIKHGQQRCPVGWNCFNQRYQTAGANNIHGTTTEIARKSSSDQR